MAKKPLYIVLALVVAAFICGALYYAIEVAELADEEVVTAFLEKYRHSSWAPLYVMGAYLLAGITFFPATVLSLAVAAVFGPVWGVIYGMTGILLSASLLFGIGQSLRGRKIKQFLGRTAMKYDKQLEQAGVAGIMTLRLIVFAPFSLFNLIVGLSSVRYSDFIIGSFLGLLPGFIARAIVGGSIIPLLYNPTLENILYLTGGVGLWVGVILLSRRLIQGTQSPTPA